jgi:hypothetical protein
MGTEDRNPEDILQKAVAILNPAERAASLEQACGGDEALRADRSAMRFSMRIRRGSYTGISSPRT